MGKTEKEQSPLGCGERFRQLVEALKRKSNGVETTVGEPQGIETTKPQMVGKNEIRSPEALAAWVGRKKYGKKKFQELATAGK